MTNERAYTPSLVLHVLRNPHGWSAEAITAARLQAADEIERLHKDLRRANAALVRHGVQTDPAMNTHPSDEPFEQRRPFAGLQSLSFDVSENPTIALVMRFDNIEHAQAARHQLWQPAGAFRDASPADLVGALQDVVHTDPGPVRAGKAHRDANSWADAKGGLPDNKL